MTKILIIDDVDVAPLMRPRLSAHGFTVDQIPDTSAAVQEIVDRKPDLVLLDLHFPGDDVTGTPTSGAQLHSTLRQRFPQLPIFIFSSRPADNTIPRETFEIEPHAIIRKPDFENSHWHTTYAKRLRHLLERCTPAASSDWLESFGFFVGQSESMQTFAHEARQAAASPLNILLIGEEGTGKELAARAIHAGSGAKGRFETVRLAPLAADQMGLDWMAEVQGGTLYLDGLADLSHEAQAALLAWIDDVQGPGSPMPRTRLIAACNRQLGIQAAQGSLNRRLYDRLAQASLCLTPLRDRLDDIPALFARCVEHFNQTAELPISTQFRPETEAVLRSHDWPGNIREFNKVVDHAIAFTGNEILMPEDIVIAARGAGPIPPATVLLPYPPAAEKVATEDNPALPLDIEQMADFYFGGMDRLEGANRYAYFKRLPPDMRSPVARRIHAVLRQGGGQLIQEHFAYYFYGEGQVDLRRFNAVRRYFNDRGIWADLGTL